MGIIPFLPQQASLNKVSQLPTLPWD